MKNKLEKNTDEHQKSEKCSRAGLHNMRPAGRMWPARSQDVARYTTQKCVYFGIQLFLTEL